MKVANALGPIEGLTISFDISDIIQTEDPQRPQCDSDKREELGGSIEFLRLSKVCKIVRENFDAVTDIAGRGEFTDMSIVRGP